MSAPAPEPPASSLQGYTIGAEDPVALLRAIELAFDYRGDVTIIRRSSPDPLDGYLFDRRPAATLNEVVLRMILRHDGSRLTIRGDDIARVHFSGRDTAAGRSFETWMKKYVARKLAGEEASLEAEEESG